MGWLKRLFGLEKEEAKDNISNFENTTINNEENVSEEHHEKASLDKPCEICTKIIGKDRYKRVGDHYFHKKCFKNKQKEVIDNGYHA